jgi:hypothetical protein
VVVLSLVCFAVLWGVVFVQMATGNDPVLSGKEAATATTRTASAARREVETTDPRELEPERHTDSKSQPRGEAAAEAELEEEAEFVEPEAEEEFVEVEAEPEFEEVEAEPLVTSQS